MGLPDNASAGLPHEVPDRLAQPVDDEQPPRLPFPVVGIGASAGGLEAVGEFLDAMRPDSGMAFVLVQHLPPDRESHLAEILGRRTAMPVRQVEDGMGVEPDHVYVIRPGRRLTIREGRLYLGPPLGSPQAANRPIDDFFRTLAGEQRERAIGVVLSGMGSNGAAGAQAIKAVGGLCIAQDPESAPFPSMPRHLIDAGYADYIVRPADLPDVLLAYAGHPCARGARAGDAEAELERDQQHVREILAVLRTRTGKDFSGYKKPTVLRRIQRRMGLNHVRSLGDYARLLRQSPTEVSGLADDMLIHVTGFFRDPEAWEALRQRVIVPLVDAQAPNGSVRAWVTACSSGEESYSLAMLLSEEAERARKPLDIKVFATDLAERTLAHARAGVYPGGIESEIPPERLARFFTREDEVYHVRPELRERVVFATQDLLRDPPFSRLDIAASRNLLIYLEPEMQERVLALLHFGLREGGTLFLGGSETIAGSDDLFETIDAKARIYRRIGPTRHGTIEFPLSHAPATPSGIAAPVPPPRGLPPRAGIEAGRPSLAERARRTLLARHTPPAVTVDRDGRVAYYHGDTHAFLQQRSGEPTRDLFLLAREGVRVAVRTALYRATASNTRVVATDGWVDLEPGRRVRVAVVVSPLLGEEPTAESGGLASHFVVSFEERGEIATAAAAESADEVRRLRFELQSTIEQLQTSNEELKASHEEGMSINEELQTANEELETSKEEMQSLNEELTSVNAQLRAKMEEHQAASSDLESLLASTDIAVLFLDTAFRIRRYTPAVRDLMELIAADVGRPATDLARRFDDPHLDEDASAVLERRVPIEREIAAADGRRYLRRVLPYRTTDGRIDGVVITFVDITELKEAESALRAGEERFRLIVASAIDYAIFTLDVDRRVTGWSPGAEAVFGYTEREMLGRSGDIIFTREDREAGAPMQEAQTALREGRAADERWHVRKDDSTFFASGVLTPLGDGGSRGFVKVLRDLSERKEIEDALREARDRLEERVTERTAELAQANATLLEAMAARTALLRRLSTAQEDERRRLSRELHDGLGQELTALILSLKALERAVPEGTPGRERLLEVERIVNGIGREAHDLAVELRPTALDDLGLGPALSAYAARWSDRTGVAAEFQPVGLEGGRLPAEVETAVYRIVQEALNNVARHAGARGVSVMVARQGSELVAVIEDDGRGFNPEGAGVAADRRSLGLLGMRERVGLVGGTLVIESGEGQGTVVQVRIPLPGASGEGL